MKVASGTQGRWGGAGGGGDRVPLCQGFPIPFPMLLVKCFQGKSATCTLHSLPRQVCSDFLASRCSCISDSDFCPVARATTLPVPAEPVLQTPVLTQCAGGRPPTCSGVGSANRKDRQPLGSQVCAVAELCAQPPSGAGGRCAPGDTVAALLEP